MLLAVPVMVMIRSFGSSVEASILIPHPDIILAKTSNIETFTNVRQLLMSYLLCLILSPPLPIIAPANFIEQ
jgi:hypothetical protein